jgi:hypothetical protein
MDDGTLNTSPGDWLLALCANRTAAQDPYRIPRLPSASFIIAGRSPSVLDRHTAHYRGLANHYGFESGKIQPRSPEENGDVEPLISDNHSYRWATIRITGCG